ncbi:MAG: GntR family transcriptional regulator [Burkholderiales bacterium]|nr:GntR family transcriptional regulator [Burkholderiales bacterium]
MIECLPCRQHHRCSQTPVPASTATPSFAPLYLQIKSLLERSLDEREWRPGEAIPSEIELAQRYGVSQGTVRKAIDVLAAENLLVRRQGKGTFVATHTEERSSLPRFLRIRRNDGGELTPASRLLDARRGKAGADVARALALRTGDAVLVLRRVLEYGNEPVVLDEITLPAALFRGLTKARYDAYRGSMYGFFESEFGVRMIKAQERIRAVAADAATAKILRTESGAPLLAVDRVTLTYGERPVEVRRGLCVTRAFHYLNELH